MQKVPKDTAVEINTQHRLEPGQARINPAHWLWAPEAIEALPWADKQEVVESKPCIGADCEVPHWLPLIEASVLGFEFLAAYVGG
jgi:hypothetical protein